MDKKRNILIRELMELIDQAKEIQTQIDSTFTKAYARPAGRPNMTLGISRVEQLGHTVPLEQIHPDQDAAASWVRRFRWWSAIQPTNRPTYAFYSHELRPG